MQVLYMGDAGFGSQWRWYRLQRLAFRLDAGSATLHQDARGRLFLNGRRRCRLLERVLRQTGYEVQPARDVVPREPLRGSLRPRTSWARLFQEQFESHIPRPSTILPTPWRRQARRLLDDPDLGAVALAAFPLPRRWRRLQCFLHRLDREGGTIQAEGGHIHVIHRGRRTHHRLLEQALRAWTTANDFLADPPRDEVEATTS